ncbi:hypothetical protein Tco_0099835 [Tanacetum coccineum]
MIAPGSSRYSSNDMFHNHYLEEARKKTQESSRNSEPNVMPSARSQSTTNGSKPKPRKSITKTKIELTLEQSQQGVSNDVLVSIEGVEELKKKCMDKGSKESSPPHNLGRNRVNTYAVRITMLISDIERRQHGPVMQCTTLPSYSGFSQQKLGSFVTEIHTISIDFLTLR